MPYPDVPKALFLDNAGPACQKIGRANSRFHLDVLEYNVPALRRVFDLFSKTVHQTPALNGSVVLLEGYPSEGVKAVPSDTSAFPNRGDNIMIVAAINYPIESEGLKQQAIAFGEDIRSIFHQATGRDELHAYVNYAYGSEDLKNVYGYEDWRQERLKYLKNKYDAKNRFGFYAPIPVND